jgi:hypothetical protein
MPAINPLQAFVHPLEKTILHGLSIPNPNPNFSKFAFFG